VSQDQQGFTLTEILVVIFLVAIISLVVSNLFIGQNRIYRVETAELNITNDARNSLDDIDNYVRQASRTLAVYSTYNAGAQVLILQIQSVNAANQLVAGKYDHVVYYLINNKLYRQVFPDATSVRAALTKLLASNVVSLTFTYNDPSIFSSTQVSTAITITESVGFQSRSISISSLSKLRNY